MLPRRRCVALLVRLAPVVLLLLLFTACKFGAPPGATKEGQSISRLYQLLFYAAIPVGVIVYGLMVWILIRYRRKSDKLPKQFRYQIPIEVLYTLIPVLLVTGLFVATYHVERNVDRLQANPAVRLNVTAFQWQWRFSYPDLGITVVGRSGVPPTMVVPAGQLVRIRLVATDVDHSFFVPDFLFKRDAIPGFPNRFDFEVDRPGTYFGECAEFCGLDHADMTFRVRAVSARQFQEWASRQGATA
jgi:cytochrome c oxidase subunit II